MNDCTDEARARQAAALAMTDESRTNEAGPLRRAIDALRRIEALVDGAEKLGKDDHHEIMLQVDEALTELFAVSECMGRLSADEFSEIMTATDSALEALAAAMPQPKGGH